ncbi:hypothetical protein N8T08_007842 [Aspergillus melleus]|uniref:Uncharacterized protein n=1 Tax=Aspergillus melleus TaxID=138277 RepID=A0ACC3AXR4_9EURO|nr:hypothetical protein N8T08_007842 [Aspergillus melleus]
MGVLPSAAKASFEPVLKALEKYNGTSLFITVTWFEFPSYPTYYNTMSGAQISGGSANSALTSRMFDKKALTSDRTALREMIGVVAGTHDELTIMSIELNGGGQVSKHDPLSGLNPAWRFAYMVEVVSRGWSKGADEKTAKAVKTDISYKKNWAMRKLTPFLGSNLNEADRNDPLWATDFYGTHYIPLTIIKKKYDPEDFFYCPTCVGSKAWYQKFLPHKDYGPLCSTGL